MISPWAAFLAFWHGVIRRTDMRILWPICKRYAGDLDHAKCAFYLHASLDPAWTDHYTKQELISYVDKLQ
jgi:hypothetical protein